MNAFSLKRGRKLLRAAVHRWATRVPVWVSAVGLALTWPTLTHAAPVEAPGEEASSTADPVLRFGTKLLPRAAFNVAGTAERASAAYVVARDANSWVEEARLLEPRSASEAGLGASVAISGDTLVAGAPGVGGIGGQGAYVFARSAGGFTEQARLEALASSGNTYGAAVAISGDTLVVGDAYYWTAGGRSGAAHVFMRSGALWILQATLVAPGVPSYANFGAALAFDGDTLAVGAPGEGVAKGAAYVYVRSAGTWELQARLAPSELQEWDVFGQALALQGDTLAVGAGADMTGSLHAATYVFGRSGSSWTQQARLVAPTPTPGSVFGSATLLAPPLLMVGAPRLWGAHGPGAVYVFVGRGSSWALQQQLSDPGGANIGAALALSGETLVAGAPESRAAVLFKLRGTSWEPADRLGPTGPGGDTRFGGALAASGYELVVGESRDDTSAGEQSGSVSVFEPFVKGDLDADLRTDLLLSRVTGGEIVAWLMNGAVRVGDAVPIEPALIPRTQRLAGVDDFDGDRRNDLVMHDEATGAIEFWLMNGTIRAAVVPISGAVPPPTNWALAATADFDHDSSPDLVWQDLATRKLVIWLMQGTLKRADRVPLPDSAVDPNWHVLVALDGDGNGTADLLWYNTATGRLVQWLLDDRARRLEGRFTNPPTPGNANWRARAAGDFGPGAGQPGAPDVLWRNLDSGRYVIWHFDFAGNRREGLFTTPPEPEGNPLDWTVVGPR